MRACCIVCCMKMMTFELAILSVLFGISTFGMVTSNHLNYTYRFDVYPLEKCPKNAHEFETAAKRKNCTGNSRYLCAPDKYLSNLIEFCTDRPVSLFKNGHCVRLEGTGDLNHYRCEDKFQRGCPTEPYIDEEIYKYPACLEINVRFHCFAADKDCPERLDKYVSDDFKKEESIHTTNTEKSDGSIKSHGAIFIFVVYVIMVTTVTGIIAFFVIKQRNKNDRKNPDILLLEGISDEKISIKMDPLQTEITSKGESGTDSCKREEKGIKTVVKMDNDKELTIRHVRGIIVGCGGAGKTTLLERLKGTSYQGLQKIRTTVIADVHPNCFEVSEEDQNIKYVGSDRTKPAILLHEGMLHEKRSTKTDPLGTENTSKDESGTDSRKRKELTGRMPNIKTENDTDQKSENNHHDIEKTTLLPDLEKMSSEEIAPSPMQSTNEKNRNEIETNKDENYSEVVNAITEELNNELSGRKHLPTQVTFLDFAGQSMYYAFHQIFLSPKTFYILVVDMTKRLDDKVEEHLDRKGKSPERNEKLCSRFESWEYKDYYKFWLESINRFSDNNTPVIIVGTHAEKLSETACNEFFKDLYALFDNHHHLKNHLNAKRRYAIGIPKRVLKLDELKEIKKCIATIAQCPRYSEHSIRFSWAVFERFLQKEKIKYNTKIISREELLHYNNQFKEYKVEDKEISKLLNCLYMAGTLLYFNEENLKDTIILDLEWFVDAFKCIIEYKVPKHETDRERQTFQKTGELLDKELEKIWKKDSNDCFFKYKEEILMYMERLELLAIYRSEEADSEKSTWYYVPSMNIRKFDMRTHGLFKSPILCFDFSEQEHNPIFVFYRLSLKCSKLPGWTFQKENGKKCIYENVVCLYFRNHTVVICVCKLQIQVQVCHKLKEVDRTLLPEIQKVIEQIMRTYHQYRYQVGYKCQNGKLNDEADDSFVDQKRFPVSGEDYCQRCTLENVHSIDNNICWVQIEDKQNKAPLQQPVPPTQAPKHQQVPPNSGQSKEGNGIAVSENGDVCDIGQPKEDQFVVLSESEFDDETGQPKDDQFFVLSESEFDDETESLGQFQTTLNRALFDLLISNNEKQSTSTVNKTGRTASESNAATEEDTSGKEASFSNRKKNPHTDGETNRRTAYRRQQIEKNRERQRRRKGNATSSTPRQNKYSTFSEIPTNSTPNIIPLNSVNTLSGKTGQDGIFKPMKLISTETDCDATTEGDISEIGEEEEFITTSKNLLSSEETHSIKKKIRRKRNRRNKGKEKQTWEYETN